MKELLWEGESVAVAGKLKENFEICIAGKNNIAVDVLDYILNEKRFPKERLCAICNRSDVGINGIQRSFKRFIKENGVREVDLEVIYPNDNLLFLSLEFDRIVNPIFFNTKHLYNIHFSLLPKYKGMYTSAMPLLFDEKESGVTFHEIDAGIDTGKIVFQERFQIELTDTCRDLYGKYIFWGTRLVKKALDIILSGRPLPEAVAQNPCESTYFSKHAVDYKNLRIDFQQTARNICNQIRAYNYREYQLPYALDFPIVWAEVTNIPSREKPGTVIWKDEDRILIASVDYDVTMFIDKFDDVIKMCYAGDLDGLKRIPKLEIYLKQSEKGGWTPLMIAARLGYYDMAMYLLSVGSDIYALNWEGQNLLMCAQEGFYKNRDDRLFKYFCKIGLEKEAKDYNGNGLIDFSGNSREEKVQLLY